MAIFAVLLVLTQLKKRVYVHGTVEVSAVHFTLGGSVPNFLALNQTDADLRSLAVSSFREIRAPYSLLLSEDDDTLDANVNTLSILPEENDPLAKATFGNVQTGEIELVAGNQVHLSAPTAFTQACFLTVTEVNTALPLVNSEELVTLRPKNALASYPAGQTDERLQLVEHGQPIFEVEPLLGTLDLRLLFAGDFELSEDDVVPVTGLEFAEERNGIVRSTVLGGSIAVEETGNTVELSKNRKLAFDAADAFDITELRVQGGNITLVFEGYTESMRIGQAGDGYVPSLLEYLYENNFMVMLFNSYMVVITFMIAISDKWKASRKND